MGKHEDSPNVLGVTVLAAVAGFVAGILFAPKSGAETRKDLKQQAKRVQKQANKGFEVAKETADEGKKELKGLVDEAMHDARELSTDAKVRAKRTIEHAKAGAGKVETKARSAWSANTKTSKKQ